MDPTTPKEKTETFHPRSSVAVVALEQPFRASSRQQGIIRTLQTNPSGTQQGTTGTSGIDQPTHPTVFVESIGLRKPNFRGVRLKAAELNPCIEQELNTGIPCLIPKLCTECGEIQDNAKAVVRPPLMLEAIWINQLPTRPARSPARLWNGQVQSCRHWHGSTGESLLLRGRQGISQGDGETLARELNR